MAFLALSLHSHPKPKRLVTDTPIRLNNLLLSYRIVSNITDTPRWQAVRHKSPEGIGPFAVNVPMTLSHSAAEALYRLGRYKQIVVDCGADASLLSRCGSLD